MNLRFYLRFRDIHVCNFGFDDDSVSYGLCLYLRAECLVDENVQIIIILDSSCIVW